MTRKNSRKPAELRFEIARGLPASLHSLVAALYLRFAVLVDAVQDPELLQKAKDEALWDCEESLRAIRFWKEGEDE